jgi:hypothetical protein
MCLIAGNALSSVAKHALQHGVDPKTCMSYQVLDGGVPRCQEAEYEKMWMKKVQDDGNILINRRL